MSDDNKYKAIIQMYSHGFKVIPKDPRVGLACVRLLNDWVVRTDKRVENAQGEMVTVSVPSQVYGIEFATTKHYWFHKGQFSAFQTELKGVQLDHEDLKIEYIKTYTPDKVKLKLKPGRVLRDYQEDAKGFAMAPVNEGDHFSKLIGMPTGTGKALADDTLVQTPDGWVKIKDIIPGDQVIGKDGAPANVLGVYPQGISPMIRLTFSDRRTIDCSFDHLWTVHSHDWENTAGGWKTIKAIDVMKYVKTKQNKISAPLLDHPNVPDQELPIDPYFLGCLLGDGSFRKMRRTNLVRFCKGDHEYFDSVIKSNLTEDLYCKKTDEYHWNILSKIPKKHSLIDKLCELGYDDETASHTKFIPDVYMKGSRRQKISLIAGLIDTDGSATLNSGRISFCTTSEVLANQLRELIWSIGAQCKMTSGVPTYVHKGEKKFGKVAYYLSIRHRWPKELCRLPRKQSKITDDYKYKGILRNRIEDAQIIDSTSATCISIDNGDGLFIAGDYLVTHNTVTICGTFAENAERAVVCVLPRYYQKWQIDLQANLDISPKQIMPVEKTSQLKGLIHIAKEQGSKKLPPLIVLTMTTIRAFIDDYEADPVGCVQDYGCAPWELWKIIGAGVVGIDEAHEHLYSVFKIAMFLHGPRFIALSGTMRTEDDFQEKVQQTIFPRFKRYLEVKMEKYIDVEFIGYHFTRDLLWKIQYKAFGRPEYSHAVLEKSIIRYARLLNGYIEMVTQILDWDYLKRKQDGDKAIIYVATVDMADKFILALTTRYPDLKVNRYCAAQGDKYEDLLASDISVSTLQSSGTAVDIPGLICNVCTTMVNSSKANIQVLGRLRKLGDKKVTLYMPFCKDIPTHFKYTQFRYELFADITKSIKTFNYGKRLGE